MFHARLPHHYAQTHDLGNVAPVIGRVTSINAGPSTYFLLRPSFSFSVMHSMKRLLTSTLVGLSLAKSVFSITPGFSYGSETVRGVSLGGWLVLEVCTQCYKCSLQ